MIANLFSEKNNLKWFILHILLGIFCLFISEILIFWIYSFFFFSINKIISDLLLRGSSKYIIPLTIYLSSFEVFARMLRLSPLIPWELSKYLFSFTFILYLFTSKKNKKSYLGIILILILIPGLMLDLSNRVTLSLLVFNLLGPLNLAFLLIILRENQIKENDFNSYLRLLWYTAISMLIYIVIKTPDISNLDLSLNANFQATADFGSNQVATILGIGMFLSFYSWMNRIEFSSSHKIDGLFIGFFAYQGFLTFSRGGMITGVLSILLYYFLLIRSENYSFLIAVRGLKPARFFSVGLSFVLVSFLIISIISEGNIKYRYLGETETTLSGEKIKTLNTITTGRLEIIKSDIMLWSENLLFGTGVGASKFMRPNHINGYASHIEYSRLIAEHGIFGLFYVLLLFSMLFRMYFLKKMTVGNALLISLFVIGILTMFHSGMRTFASPVFIALSSMIIIDNDKNAVL